eukprot:6442885-Amphidinium_carterae.1
MVRSSGVMWRKNSGHHTKSESTASIRQRTVASKPDLLAAHDAALHRLHQHFAEERKRLQELLAQLPPFRGGLNELPYPPWLVDDTATLNDSSTYCGGKVAVATLT